MLISMDFIKINIYLRKRLTVYPNNHFHLILYFIKHKNVFYFEKYYYYYYNWKF